MDSSNQINYDKLDTARVIFITQQVKDIDTLEKDPKAKYEMIEIVVLEYEHNGDRQEIIIGKTKKSTNKKENEKISAHQNEVNKDCKTIKHYTEQPYGEKTLANINHAFLDIRGHLESKELDIKYTKEGYGLFNGDDINSPNKRGFYSTATITRMPNKDFDIHKIADAKEGKLFRSKEEWAQELNKTTSPPPLEAQASTEKGEDNGITLVSPTKKNSFNETLQGQVVDTPTEHTINVSMKQFYDYISSMTPEDAMKFVEKNPELVQDIGKGIHSLDLYHAENNEEKTIETLTKLDMLMQQFILKLKEHKGLVVNVEKLPPNAEQYQKAVYNVDSTRENIPSKQNSQKEKGCDYIK